MSAIKKIPTAVKPQAAPTQPPAVADPLRCEALADPLLSLARAGKLSAGCYDDAWDAIEKERPGAYQPQEDAAQYLRVHWQELLAEPAENISAAQRSRRGRPTLLTPELLAQIEELAEDGLKDPQIYAKLAIRQQTWNDWSKDEEGELSVAIAQARARMAHRMVRLIPTMEKGWQAPVWLLTQHFPGDYSRPNAETTVNVSALATASAMSEVKVSKEELEKRQARTKRKLQHQIERLRLQGGQQSFVRPPEG